MKFWGVEVKPGTPLKVELDDGYVYHISQIALGDVKKVKEENVPVYVNVGDDNKQKLIIGNISQDIPQFTSIDLVIEKNFELSHECDSSVFVLGYKAIDFNGQDEEIDSDDSEEEEAKTKFLQDLAKQEAVNGMNSEETKVEDDESESDSEDDSDSEGEDEDSDDSDEFDEAPLKVEPPSKKRANGGALNTIAPVKKIKVPLPQKASGGKKGGKCC